MGRSARPLLVRTWLKLNLQDQFVPTPPINFLGGEFADSTNAAGMIQFLRRYYTPVLMSNACILTFLALAA
mgnify:CR=1 FL=1